MQIDFTNRTVLVTGATRGIGKQVAIDMVSCGAEVIVTSTRQVDAENLLDNLGANARHFAVDFSDRESTTRFLDAVRSLPKLDVLINNAGIARHGPIAEVVEKNWDETNDVNLKGSVLPEPGVFQA